MPKSYTKNKYRFEWLGKNTGYNYRLDMIPSDTTEFSATPTVVTMPEDCLLMCELNGIEYDKYPFGLPKTPELKLKFNINLTRDTSSFNTALKNSNQAFDFTFNFFNDTYFIGVDKWELYSGGTLGTPDLRLAFLAGNQWLFYIQFNGDDDTATPPPYRLMFQGIQQPLNDYEYVEGEYEYEITYFDINKVCMENTSLVSETQSNLQEFWQHYDSAVLEFYDRNSYWNYVDKDTNNDHWLFSTTTPQANPSGTPDNYFWFISISRLKTFLEKLCSETKKKLVRDNDAAITFDFPQTTFYKQIYDGTGGKGDTLLFNGTDTLFILGWVTNKSKANALDADLTFSDMGFCKKVINDYKNVYDFYYDGISEQFVNKGFYYYTNTNVSALTRTYLYNNDGTATLDLADCWDNRLILEASVLNNVEVGESESLGDDIEDQKFVNPMSRNSNGFTLPILFHNKMARSQWAWVNANEWYFVHLIFTDSDNITRFAEIVGDNKIYSYKLFYKATPVESAVTLSTQEVFIGVHEHIQINFGTINSDTLLSNTTLIPFEWDAYKNDTYLNYSKNIQNKQSVGAIAGNSLLKLFDDPANQFRLKGKTLINNTVYFTGGGAVGCLWFNVNNIMVTVDIASLAPPHDTDFLGASPTGNEFYLTKCKMDFLQKEEVEYEFFSNYYIAP